MKKQEKVTIRQTKDKLEISCSWFNEKAIFSSGFVVLIGIAVVYSGSFGFLNIFIIGYALFNLLKLLATFKNHTTISIDSQSLRVINGPIPAFNVQGHAFRAEELKQAYVYENQDKGRYSVKAFVRNNTNITIVDEAIGLSKEDAIRVETAIETFIGVKDAVIIGEVKDKEKVKKELINKQKDLITEAPKARTTYTPPKMPEMPKAPLFPSAPTPEPIVSKKEKAATSAPSTYDNTAPTARYEWRNGDVDTLSRGGGAQHFNYHVRNKRVTYTEQPISPEVITQINFNFDFHPFSILLEDGTYDLDKYHRGYLVDHNEKVKQWTYINRDKTKMIRIVELSEQKEHWIGQVIDK